MCEHIFQRRAKVFPINGKSIKLSTLFIAESSKCYCTENCVTLDSSQYVAETAGTYKYNESFIQFNALGNFQ